MNYKEYLPKNVDDYKSEIIENITKIENKNILISGKSGYGKTHLKNILVEKIKKENKFIKVIYLNLEDDLKKTKETSTYMINMLKLSQKKLFIIDNLEKLEINEQIYIKSLIKNYKNLNFLIFLNETSSLIENFHSLFIFFKLDNNFFETNKNKICKKLKSKIKITKKQEEYIKKSKNFYELRKNCIFYILFKKSITKNINKYKTLTTNNNEKIIKIIINNNFEQNIKYIDELLDKGYSENNIVNFIINSLNKENNIKNRNTIINIILELELNRLNYSYIDLIYIVEKLSIVDNNLI